MSTALFRVTPLLFGRIPGNWEVVAYVPINENGNLKNAKASQELTGRELWRTFNVAVDSSRPILGHPIRKIQEKNLVQKEEP